MHGTIIQTPHNINSKVSSELKEELKHLSQVGGVAMGVQDGEPREGVPPEGGHDLVPALGVQQVHIHVPVSGQPREQHPPVAVGRHFVRRRVRRVEGQPRRHTRRHIAHHRKDAQNK